MAKTRFAEFFEDENGQLSFKRIQTAAFTLAFLAAIVAKLIWDKELGEGLLGTLTALLIYGYSGIVVEGKFKNPKAPDALMEPTK